MKFKKHIIRAIIPILLLGMGLMGYTRTHEHLQQYERKESFAQRDRYTLPSSDIISVLALNYDTFASSMVWIAGLVYFGDWRLSPHEEPPKYLESYARAIADLDPNFYYVYEWFTAIYVNSHLPGVTYEDLDLVADFLEQGIERFPSRHELPYTAGLLYIGYSTERSKALRLKEYTRGAEFLEHCIKLSRCPTSVPLTLAHYRSKQQELSRELRGDEYAPTDAQVSEEESELYKRLYLATADEELQGKLADLLRTKGIDPKQLDTSRKERLKRHYDAERPYLPLGVWSMIVYPQDDAL